MIKRFTRFRQLSQDALYSEFERFVAQHHHGSYFQSSQLFQLLDGLDEFQPILFISLGERGEVVGSLLGYYQVFGTKIRGWMSRRFVVMGGPLVDDGPMEMQTAYALLSETKSHARKLAIYIEIRNLFDTMGLRPAFEKHGFYYTPHLNYLLKLDDEPAVMQRLSSSRRRQLKKTVAAGATISEAVNEKEVMTFYGLLRDIYRTRIRKPLASPEFFLKFWRTNAGKVFLVKYDGEIMGGIICPIFNNRIIYEWYVCGRDGEISNVHSSVVATWAPIEYGLQNGLSHFDFLGAGKPDEPYGVREFKARFGGDEVCFGRYEYILNKPLFAMSKIGLRIYRNFCCYGKRPKK